MPLWLTTLSSQLLVVGLVGRYPTNYLISRRFIPFQEVTLFVPPKVEIMGFYPRFLVAIPQIGGDTYVLLSRPPLTHFLAEVSSLDLHISGTPPTFILSQDQTLQMKT